MTTHSDDRGRDRSLPLQDELLDLDRLREHARALAAALPVGRSTRGRNRLDRHADNALAIGRAYQLLTDDARYQRLLSPAADWMLDNHHLVMAELRALRRDLPEGYYDELPALSTPSELADVRVYEMALELVRHTDSRLDRHQFTTFLNSFQSVTPLAIGELWAWPSMVRLALIENLRRLADQVVSERADRLAADAYYAGFPNDHDAPIPGWPDAWHSPFVAQLLHRIREQGPTGARLQQAIDDRLAARDLRADEVVRDAHQQQAATQLLMANVVTSLRLCATIDWGPLVESVSVVDRVLRQDPSGAYPGMDFQSRDRQRQAVERIARPSGESQVRVAIAAVDRARRAHAADELRAGHVGDQLVGEGRAAIEAALDLKPSLTERARRFAGRHAAGLYLVALAAATATLLAIPDAYLRQQSAGVMLRLLAAGVLLVPASEVAVALVNRLVAMLVPPDRLPRLDFSNGIPAAARTMVVVPTLFSSAKGVAALLEQLEIAALGNPDPHIHFAILSDFPDAPEQHRPADAALLSDARAGIARLNSGPWSDGGRRFF
ncbi:MAG: carbohydrate-binding protein, partial [Acidobacteriota bacterium]